MDEGYIYIHISYISIIPIHIDIKGSETAEGHKLFIYKYAMDSGKGSTPSVKNKLF